MEFGVSQQNNDSIYDVLIVYGQSNAAGEAATGGDTTGFPTMLPKSKMYNFNTKQIETLTQNIPSSSGVNSTGHAWGEFANTWQRETGRGCVVVNCARGAQAIAALTKGASSGSSDYYGLLVSAVASVKQQMKNQNLTMGKLFVVWHQGETDMTNGTPWQTYKNSLAGLIDVLATDISFDFFGICTVGSPTTRSERSWSTIQTAQRYVAQGRPTVGIVFDGCSSFKAADNSLGGDGTHYTQTGYNTMGYFAAIGFKEMGLYDITRKTRSDIEIYKGVQGDTTRMSKHFAASIQNISNVLTILDSTLGDGAIIATNARTIQLSTDTYSLLIKVGDYPTYWSQLRASMTNLAGFTIETSLTEISSEKFVKLDFYQDLTFGIKVTDGTLYTGIPLSSDSSGYLASIFTTTYANNICTLTHNTNYIQPTATIYGDGSMTDSSGFLSVRSQSATQTLIKVISTTNPVAIVRFPRIRVYPSNLVLAGNSFIIKVSGIYSQAN
jgi:hypothetical protein